MKLLNVDVPDCQHIYLHLDLFNPGPPTHPVSALRLNNAQGASKENNKGQTLNDLLTSLDQILLLQCYKLFSNT